MDVRLEKLIKAFESKGWMFKGFADISIDWWFRDILHFGSAWRPADTNIYLTLLTDPDSSNQEDIWCVGVSSDIPDSRHYDFIDQITLNDIKRTDLLLLVDNINKVVLADKRVEN